jgi:branched-chain amino acid transport system substrate-binding protein
VRSILHGTATVCVALLLAGTACSSTGSGSPPARTITIGVDLPLTGDEGRAGSTTLNGIRFFVLRHPTLDGFNIAIDARDDAGGASRDTARGLQNVQAFIADPRILAMIGPLDSITARAEIPVANREHLAMVSPATSSRCLTKEPHLPAGLNPTHTPVSCKSAGLPSPDELRPTKANNFFRLSTTDELQGPAAADYASNRLHLQRIALVSDTEAYGQTLAKSFSARFIRLGGSVVAQTELDPSKPVDLTAFLQQAKANGAQGLYFGGTSSNSSCVVRSQMGNVFGNGDSTPFLGGDGIALDPVCVRDAGANATGTYATVPALDAAHIDSAKPVIKDFKSEYGRPRDYGTFTLAAYDAAGLVYDALDRAIKAAGGNIPARDSIVSELAWTSRFHGATGTFGFDAAGDTTLRLVSIFKPSSRPQAAWIWVATVDYSAALPY